MSSISMSLNHKSFLNQINLVLINFFSSDVCLMTAISNLDSFSLKFLLAFLVIWDNVLEYTSDLILPYPFWFNLSVSLRVCLFPSFVVWLLPFSSSTQISRLLRYYGFSSNILIPSITTQTG